MMLNYAKLCFTAFILVSSISSAKIFRNSYLSFEAPDSWNCNLENTEWICRAKTEKEAKEAIIVLTAKEVGPMDTFDAYSAHLNAPQATSYKGAAGALSKVVYPPKKVSINDQPWIDGLHMASEVPSYYTRYLATTKDHIAILFTCSAYKDYYSKYSTDFFKAVQTLRVIAPKDLLNQKPSDVGHTGDIMGGGSLQMPGDLIVDEDGGQKKASGGGMNSKGLFMGLAVVLAALGIYLFMKSRKS